MERKRPKLIPSSDLAEFYRNKISVSLSLIYTYGHEILEGNRRLIIKVNHELQEIFKMIKKRLIEHEYKSLVEEFESQDTKLKKLKPISITYIRDGEGNRIKKQIITKDYANYKIILEEKESIIYECLDVLGLLGKLEEKTKRLR